MRVMTIKPIAKAPRSFPKRSPPDSRIMQIKTCTQLVSRPPIIRNLQRRLPKKCPKLRREAFEIRDLWPFSATVVNAGFERRKIWGGNCVAMSCACEKALFSKTVQETGKMTFLTLELSFGLLSLALKTTSLLSVVQGKYSEKGLQLNAISFPFSRRKKHCLPPYVPLRRGGLLMSKPPSLALQQPPPPTASECR